MPPEIFKHLKKVWVSGQQLRITRNADADDGAPFHRAKPRKPPSFDRGGFAAPKRPGAKKKTK